jgi:hypothetical protein
MKDRKAAVKQRVRDGVLDLAFLYDQLPDNYQSVPLRERDFLSDDVLGELYTPEVESDLISAFSLLYLASLKGAYHPENFIEEGIRRGEEEKGPYTVDVEVSIERRHMGELPDLVEEKMEEGERLTDAEIRAALESGEIPPEQLAEYLQDGGE